MNQKTANKIKAVKVTLFKGAIIILIVVALIGVCWWIIKRQRQVEIPTLFPPTSAISIPIPNSEYQSFINPRYDYTLEYPKKWRADPSVHREQRPHEQTPNQSIRFISPDSEIIFLGVWENVEMPLMEWYEKYEGSHKILENPPKSPNAKVAGEEAITVATPYSPIGGPGSLTTVFAKANHVFKIDCAPVLGNSQIEAYKHLLETLEFDNAKTEDMIPPISSEKLYSF